MTSRPEVHWKNDERLFQGGLGVWWLSFLVVSVAHKAIDYITVQDPKQLISTNSNLHAI